MTGRHGEHGLGDDPRYQGAWEFVIDHQGTQDRKGSDEPYTVHLRGTARRVLEDRGAPEEVVAALLHDVVEDTPRLLQEEPELYGPDATVATVREHFGDRVAHIVEFCSDTDPEPVDGKAPWRGRKERHFEHLADADPGALRVVVADKTDNITGQIARLQAAGGDPMAVSEFLLPFKGGFAGTLWYYRGMRAAMGDKLAGSELYENLGKLILRFSQLRRPSDAEVETRDRLRMLLDALDPRKVGPVRIAEGHYSIDAHELARRVHCLAPVDATGRLLDKEGNPVADPERHVVDTLVDQWYGEDSWSDDVRRSLAQAFRQVTT